MLNLKKSFFPRYFKAIIIAVFIVSIFLMSSCRMAETVELNAGSIYSSRLDYTGEIIELKNPPDSNYLLNDALVNRRSVRNFSGKKIEPEKVSAILWAAQGITAKDSGFRTAPSAGALYPLDVFLLDEDGVYHYIPDGHKLMKMKNNDLRNELYKACLFQGPVSEAVINIIITAEYERTTVKYGQRGIRYADMEAGHACQNILLIAVAMELGAVPIGAFRDDDIKKILGLPADYIPLYVIPVGYPQ